MEKTIDFLLNDLKLNNKDKIVVACSGGPDSMCLLHILKFLRENISFTLICAHINHNVREESYDEYKFLKKYCEDNNILFEYHKIDKYDKTNFESQARKIRYNFFKEIINKYSGNYLMTAHHADDLMETILMRLSRGSNFSGYRGFDIITEEKNYKTVRPLIFYTKKEIEEYNDTNNIKYVVDQTNFTNIHTRNRYRKKILPFLKSENQNIHKHFIKYNSLMKMCDNYITKNTKKLENKVYSKDKIKLDLFSKEEDIIKYTIIEKWLYSYYKDDIYLITDEHKKLIFKLINSPKASSYITLPNKVIIEKEYNNLFIKSNINVTNTQEKTEIDKLKAYTYYENLELNNNSVCKLLKEEIKFPLYERRRKEGDKISLNGGTKKLKDIFIDSKIPKRQRDTLPIIVDSNDTVIWIPNIKKSKFCKKNNEIYDIIIRYSKEGEKSGKEKC